MSSELLLTFLLGAECERTDQSDDETKAPAAAAPSVAAPKVVLPKKSRFAGEDEGDKKEDEVSLSVWFSASL